MTRAWTTAADIRAKVLRRWTDGGLTTAYLLGEPCPVIEVPIRGPAAREIGSDLAGVRQWRAALERASGGGAAVELEFKAVGGRAVGRNELPARARVSSFDQAWRLLGVGREVAALDAIAAATRAWVADGGARSGSEFDLAPPDAVLAWVARTGLRLIPLVDDWDRILATARWLDRHAGRRRYLRQIDIPGVDTKFIERHRAVLAGLLDVILPEARIDDRHSRGAGFCARYGFAEPESLIRVRCVDEFAGLPPGVSEVAWRAEELSGITVSVDHVVIVENLVTYLALPVPQQGVVIWGSGYAVGRLGRIPWIQQARRVSYAGDLDTHGFAILSMLRGQVTHVESLLMDRDTLFIHRERWGQEPAPTRARLDHLTEDEQSLYQDLVEDVYASSLRLEQERLAWPHVLAALDWA